MHEWRADVPVYIDMIPVDPSMMLPPCFDRLQSPGRNTRRIGDRCRVAIPPADADAMYKRGWLRFGSAVLGAGRLVPVSRFRHDPARFPALRCGCFPNPILLLAQWQRKRFQRPP